MYPNGTSVMLEQVGGMLAYYLQYGDNIVEFPQGFQMIAGDPYRRNFTCQTPEPPKSQWSGYEVSQDALSQKALGFNCLNYAKAAEPSLGRHGLPTKDFVDQNCPDGLRLELFFPSCWNGKDATAPDHKSHMAYPSLVQGGDCPAGYDKRTPSLFFETIWNTAAFKGVDGQFVVSTGDPTGYSYHGDFIAAWSPGFLQQAIQQCTDGSGEVSACKLFDLNTDDEMGQCTFPSIPELKSDDCQGPMQGLPGGCKIQGGPERATPPSPSGNSGLQTSSSASLSSSKASPSSSAGSTPIPSQSSQPQSAAASRPGSTTGDLVLAEAVSTATGTSSSSATPSSAAAASVTGAPSGPAPSSNCGSTTTMIKDGTQYDVCVVDEVETVTASAAPSDAAAQQYKRHLHEHAHHRRAGHSGHF